jgi:hypothetical protein
MARSWIAVQVGATRLAKWRRLSGAARGALVTVWLDYAGRDEAPWRSLEDLTEHLVTDGFPASAVEELARLGWLDLDADGVRPHDWRDWQFEAQRSFARDAERERKRAERAARPSRPELSGHVRTRPDTSGQIPPPPVPPSLVQDSRGYRASGHVRTRPDTSGHQARQRLAEYARMLERPAERPRPLREIIGDVLAEHRAEADTSGHVRTSVRRAEEAT